MCSMMMNVRVVQTDRHPATSALSPVLDEMLRIHGRLQPHLLRYRQLMSDDQDYTNRVCVCRFCFTAMLCMSQKDTHHDMTDGLTTN